MLKKIALGVLLTGLVAVLVLGAVIRTQAKTGESAAEAGGRYRDLEAQSTTYEGNGGRWSETDEQAETRGGRWNEATDDDATFGGRWNETIDDDATFGGRWNEANAEAVGRGGRWQQTDETGEWQGQGLGSANADPQADVQPADWETLTGVVASVTDDLVEVELSAARSSCSKAAAAVCHRGRAGTNVGDTITLNGFEEDGEFKIGQVTAPGGITITLRDESGRPGWSGRGRRADRPGSHPAH